MHTIDCCAAPRLRRAEVVERTDAEVLEYVHRPLGAVAHLLLQFETWNFQRRSETVARFRRRYSLHVEELQRSVVEGEVDTISSGSNRLSNGIAGDRIHLKQPQPTRFPVVDKFHENQMRE